MNLFARFFRKYDPDQPRDQQGQRTDGGGGGPQQDTQASDPNYMRGTSLTPVVFRGGSSGRRDRSESFPGRVYVSTSESSARQWGEVRSARLARQPRVLDLGNWNGPAKLLDSLDDYSSVKKSAPFDRPPEYVRKAKSRTAATAIHEALKRFEPRVAAAFREAARAVRDRASLRAVAAALEAGDLEKAADLLGAAALGPRLVGDGLEPGARSARDELLSVLATGGEAGIRQLPRTAAIRASLDLTNPEAVRYLRERVPELVREVTLEQREALRQAALRGMSEGRPIPAIAREMREAVGLTRGMQTYVANFRRQLETGQLGSGTAPWARRLSGAEQQQARSIFLEGGEQSARVDAIVARYSESLLNRRAENIARTETHSAFVEGQKELWRQAEAAGFLDPRRVRRVWITTPDDRLRPDHAAVPGMNPAGVGLHEPFATPVGPVMEPGASGDGAFDINCFLPGTIVRGSFVAGLESWYSGEAVEIVTARGARLTVTPNHPILTTIGLVPAGRLSKGQYLVADRSKVVNGPAGAEEDQDGPSLVEDVFQALSVAGSGVIANSAVDFHGDEAFIEGDVRQVGADGFLKGHYFSGVREQLRQRALILPNISFGPGVRDGAPATLVERPPLTAHGVVRVGDLLSPLPVGHLRPFNPLRVGSTADMDAVFFEHPRDGVAGNVKLVAQLFERGAGLVAPDEVVGVRRYPFSGHVYDLQSVSGFLSAGTIITSNCRCTVALEFDE